MSNSKRTRALAAALLGASLAAAGCEPPPTIPSAPPGVDIRESLMPKEDASQAIGETSPTAAPSILPGLVPAIPTARGETRTTPSGVEYTTLKEGTGATAAAGQRVTVHYVGTLDDGRVFDNSRGRDKPTPFEIGTGKVIKGWDEAVPGMKVGELRKMTIPPSAGYGAQGKAPIPANATLHFEVELVKVE